MKEISNTKGRVVVLYTLSLVLVFALAGAVVLYLAEHSRVADLNQRNEELKTQVQQLQNESDIEQPDDPSGDQAATIYKSKKGKTITIYAPQSGAMISSQLGVIGKVPGSWSFEASFPVQLRDGNGKVIAEEPAQIQGDWMTESNVPFAAVLTYDKPATPTGTLVLQKANASGLAENDDSVSIPVKFI